MTSSSFMSDDEIQNLLRSEYGEEHAKKIVDRSAPSHVLDDKPKLKLDDKPHQLLNDTPSSPHPTPPAKPPKAKLSLKSFGIGAGAGSALLAAGHKAFSKPKPLLSGKAGVALGLGAGVLGAKLLNDKL